MNFDQSEIHLSIYQQGGFKPRLGKEIEKNINMNLCTKKVTLGPAFIKHALKDPEPAKKLKVLKELAPNLRRRSFQAGMGEIRMFESKASTYQAKTCKSGWYRT